MSYVTRRKSRRKFKHQPTNVDGLSQLLTKCSVSTNYGGGDDWEDIPNKIKRSSRLTSPSPERRENKRNSNRNKSDSIAARGASSNEGIRGFEAETHLDNISFRLGSTTYEMDESGHWKTDKSNSNMTAEILKLRQGSTRISQENNLLRVKNELLTDMIAKKTLRRGEVEQELQRLKKVLSKSSSRFSMSLEKGHNVDF